jgi:hypothetical protein
MGWTVEVLGFNSQQGQYSIAFGLALGLIQHGFTYFNLKFPLDLLHVFPDPEMEEQEWQPLSEEQNNSIYCVLC